MNRLQFITHFTDKYTYVDSARIALEGGCRWIQLRMKDAIESELENAALQVKSLCAEYGAKFIIDDNVMMTKHVGADGVHLGKNDMPVDEARKILGSNYIIGGTANIFDDICRLYAQGADYIGCGPFRFTTTKKNLAAILGLDGYARLLKQMDERGIRLPLIAIGGIEYDDIPALFRIGVSGIALSGSVLRAADPVSEMRRIVNLIKQKEQTL